MTHKVIIPLAGSKQVSLDMAAVKNEDQESLGHHDPENNKEWLNLGVKNLPRTLKLDIFSSPTYDQK